LIKKSLVSQIEYQHLGIATAIKQQLGLTLHKRGIPGLKGQAIDTQHATHQMNIGFTRRV